MKECDDPESNRINVGFWLTGNLPAVMGSPSGISSIVVWCTPSIIGLLLLSAWIRTEL
jgi:hypothetical protein